MVVWTKDDPNNIPLKDLLENSERAYVSFKNSRLVEDPETDPHWNYNNPFTDNQSK